MSQLAVAPVTVPTMPMPTSMRMIAMTRPSNVTGVKSPYPTVATVAAATTMRRRGS